MKITDYSIASAGDFAEFIKTVRGRIEKGWQPFGGLVVTLDASDCEWFYQPMVKYDV